MKLIEQGLKKALIQFDAEQKNISYLNCNKKYRYSDPEEKVRAETYLSLILDYGYEPEKIDLEFKVPHRTPNNLADIVVFKDKAFKTPYIVVECKKADISEAEFSQAIEQGFGNANSLKAKFLWIESGVKQNFYNVADFPSMEREVNKIANLPKLNEKEGNAFKYTKAGKKGGVELEKVEQAELTRVFKKCHDALWDGGKRNPSEAFDELDKLIFCKIWDERTPRKPGTPYDFQIFSNEKAVNLLNRVKGLYAEGRKKDAEVFKEDIRLIAAELETVVGYLSKLNLSETDLDSKGRAFETFMGDFFRGDFGQYFTPRPIVQFVIDSLPFGNENMMLDPACGSGGFLLYELDKVRHQADKMVEEGYFKSDSREHYAYWHDFAERNLFGIEISEQIARTAKMNMIIHDDGHTNVVAFDGLVAAEKLAHETGNQNFKLGTFDFIATNPPFGSSIKKSEKRYLADYDLGNKGVDWVDAKLKNINLNKQDVRIQQSTEVLFIEQCFNYLKADGVLAMVVPDGILTNSSLQYVRDWVENHFRILAVVSMPQTAFSATGAGVKSSVIFLRKYSEEKIAAILEIRARLQDSLFEKAEYGVAIEELEQEKKRVVKKGDAGCQAIDDAWVNKLESLKAQGSLTAGLRKELQKEAKVERKAYEASEGFKVWKVEVTDGFNERIRNLKEALQEDYVEQVKREVTDYPIFMAIAENIGYDATGRETGVNELVPLAGELRRFIESVIEEQADFFQLASL
ncbi:N-6 DNA methylase [Candidatus Halobeggiatoa sp. HSG11]|nr:N-6 DNA methylase [Candidatus Halobeggiatoa sp. HSG11]